MTFVLDASIAACWCFSDEQDDRADIAFERLFSERALVPLLWWYEVRNVVLIGERRKRITGKETTEFLDRLEKFSVDLAPFPDRTAVMTLARRHGLTFYDATYLELAQREEIPLATLDRALTAAAPAEHVTLVSGDRSI